MKKILIALVLLALCLSSASAEDAGIPGQPFPDFTVTDTLGNTFTLSEALGEQGAALITSRKYGQDTPADSSAPQAYILHVIDQNGAPVPDTAVTFCTDTACVLAQADENGVITFDGAPDVYHVQLLKVPDGYSFDAGFELTTDAAYSEWMLRVRKD